MGNIGGKFVPVHPSPLEAVEVDAYLDTIELFFRRDAYQDLRQFEATTDGVHLHRVEVDGWLIGYRLVLQQPTVATIKTADRLQRKHQGTLRRVDVAYDFTSSRFEAMKQALDRGLILKWRRSGPIKDEENGWYAIDFSQRKRPSRTVAYYADRHSKITGEVDCVHIELRLLNRRAVKNAGYDQVKDLQSLDPRKLFAHHLYVVQFGESQFERFKQRIIRRNIRTTRRPGKKQSAIQQKFMDQYTASQPRRLNGLLNRVHRGRAMSVKSNHDISRLTRVDISGLIPTALSFSMPSNIEVKGKSENTHRCCVINIRQKELDHQ